MLGITSHSKIPLRLATMAGFALSILSLLVAVVYLILKLVWWDTFNLGLAPLVIGVYFFGAIQLFFIGMLGEYIGSIHTQVHHRPYAVERERIISTTRRPTPPIPIHRIWRKGARRRLMAARMGRTRDRLQAGGFVHNGIASWFATMHWEHEHGVTSPCSSAPDQALAG